MKILHARELSRNQTILRSDVILQQDWQIEQCLLQRRFFGGKTKSPCFDLFIHWLRKQITNTFQNHISRSYENRCMINKQERLMRQRWNLRALAGILLKVIFKGCTYTDVLFLGRPHILIDCLKRHQAQKRLPEGN